VKQHAKTGKISKIFFATVPDLTSKQQVHDLFGGVDYQQGRRENLRTSSTDN
jgi:hypothetical protein